MNDPGTPDPTRERSTVLSPAIGRQDALGTSIARLLGTPLLRVSGYRIEDTLGEGGMGMVYRAIQESLGRPVALKVIRADHATDADFRERFIREARLAGELNHPNIVACHDAGIDQGRHYLAMELVDGGDLRQLVAAHGGSLPVALALSVARDVAAGLEAIHAAGIIHRDIKPANLLVTRDGRIKIADLGLARRIDNDVALTSRGITPGTPAFMAPEQARNATDLDHRADIYALGSTLYYLLTGQHPFSGASHYEVVAQILARSIPDPAGKMKACPPGVSLIIRRSGAVRSRDRYANALEMRADLERALVAALALPRESAQASALDSPPTPPVLVPNLPLPNTAGFRHQAAAVLRKLRAAALSMSSSSGSRMADELEMLTTMSADLGPLSVAAREIGLTWFAEVAEASDRAGFDFFETQPSISSPPGAPPSAQAPANKS